MLPEPEIQALVHLLDDTDREVLRHVHERLKSYGSEVIPALENAWTTDLNPLQHQRLEEIIHEIQYDGVRDEMVAWLHAGATDLLKGYYIVSRYFFPEITLADIQKKVHKVRQAIWLELNHSQTPIEQIQIFNQVLFSHLGYKAEQVTEAYPDYCINHMLETRHGSSIGLGILYQIIAQDLQLPVYGVRLVKYYVLCFAKRHLTDFHDSEGLEALVMFYINPINKGTLFSRNEIKDYLTKMKADSHSAYFIPSDNKQVIVELLTYLMELSVYKKQPKKAAELKMLKNFLNA